jgi:hypothetical protein
MTLDAIRDEIKDAIAEDNDREERSKRMVLDNDNMREANDRVHAKEFEMAVLPNSAFRRHWDILTLVLLAYTAIFTPFQVSFYGDIMRPDNTAEWLFVAVLDRIVDVIFGIDIIVNFRSAWEEQGILVFNSKDACLRYIKFWFWLDLMSVFPFREFMSLVSNGDASTARLSKMIRLFRLAKIFRVLRASRIVKRWEQHLSIKFGVIRLVVFIVCLVFIMHLLACGFFIAASIGHDLENNWLQKHGLIDVDVGQQYLTAVYWAIATLTTIGYGDVSAGTQSEKVWVIISMCIGAGYYAYVVGTMCTLLHGLNIQNIRFQEQMDAMNEYLTFCDAPGALRLRIRQYCFYRRDMQKRENEHKLLACMSLSLKAEMVLHNHGFRVSSVPHFCNANKRLQSAIAELLRPATFGPNDIIIDAGQPIRDMMLVVKGTAQIEKWFYKSSCSSMLAGTTSTHGRSSSLPPPGASGASGGQGLPPPGGPGGSGGDGPAPPPAAEVLERQHGQRGQRWQQRPVWQPSFAVRAAAVAAHSALTTARRRPEKQAEQDRADDTAAIGRAGEARGGGGGGRRVMGGGWGWGAQCVEQCALSRRRARRRTTPRARAC